VYVYLDHLGTVRLTYSDFNDNGSIEPATEILQERNTYPFGLEHKGYNNVQNGTESNYQTYLGQEMNKELGLNWLSFRHRNYDPTIGRFFGIDPITEEYHYITPYQFASNNPVWKVEIEGLEGQETSGLDLIRQGFANIWNAMTGGVESTENGMRLRSAKSRATQFATGGNMVAKGAATKEVAHVVLDAAGAAEPTPFIDTGHAIWYGVEGEYGNALLTGAGVIPYFGDGFKTLKYAKYSDEVADLVSLTGKLDGGKEVISVLNSGTLDDGIKVATDVIGGLGDDAVEHVGKFGSQKGVTTGYKSANGKKGWRVDYDATKGGHINWWNGKEKGAIILNAGQDQIDQIIKNGTFK
jgi:RHS repeat-associated protein